MAGVIHPVLVAELRDARIAKDRITIEKAKVQARVEELEEENEALRNTIASLAHAAGGGGNL